MDSTLSFAAMVLDLHVLALFVVLFITGLVAGWVNTIAGGGGLITLPVFLAVGVPPQFALGTNKLQASIGSITASYYYVRQDFVAIKDSKFGILCTLIGAAAGAWSVQQIHTKVLDMIIPIMLLATTLYTIFTPSLGMTPKPPRMKTKSFYILIGTTFGFYDGFFGPGIGSFWIFALVLLLGFDLAKATGYAKILNGTSNLVALAVFLIGGYVWFGYALMMSLGQIVGSRAGAGHVMKNGSRIVRPIFITILLGTTLKLIYDKM